MASKIFHQGPINTAISSAVQQGISLVFFVTDNGDQSNKWENVYLRNLEILPLLQEQSILLRLQQGSAEAAFLPAFCPVQEVPYIAIVKNGALIANVASDVESQGEFIQRIQSAFRTESQAQATSPPSASASSTPINATAALFAERKARLEALEGRRKAQEKEEREKRIAREKARREAESPARAKYVQQQRKLREDDLAERQRVLLLVENDKIERREREQRKKQTLLACQPAVTPNVTESKPSSTETAISFRLLDGTTLKSKFLSSSKLSDVRRWLDRNRTDGAVPYSFQQVLPNKSLSASDENSSLKDLSFSNATTLVLVHPE